MKMTKILSLLSLPYSVGWLDGRLRRKSDFLLGARGGLFL